ncbi:MAG: helix-turn-helix domain-containing protein [Tissierellia bacterium]|nr:helix-turn-helix domain-containing protein [Tissierellia bacterium]
MDYLEGEGGYKFLADKYKVNHKSLVEKWVNSYTEFGIDGLRKKMKNNQYSGEFKLSVLEYRKLNELSYRDTANLFNINNSSMISNWQRKYDEEGFSGLENKKRGRPKKDMSNDNKITNSVTNKLVEQPLNETERQELKRLREENEYLRMSLEVEKKLQALVREKKLKAKKNLK